MVNEFFENQHNDSRLDSFKFNEMNNELNNVINAPPPIPPQLAARNYLYLYIKYKIKMIIIVTLNFYTFNISNYEIII